MSNNTPRAGTSPFASLLSFWAPKGQKAEEQKTGDDEEARKARRAEEDERRQEEDARRAEEDQRRDDEDARRAEEDDGNDPAEPDPADEGKKGKKAEDGDDDQDPEADADDDDADAEEGMDEDQAKAFRRGLALGRARELARCARIFGSPAAVANPGAAVTLAFTTRNSSAAAGRLMSTFGAAPKPRGRSLGERMGERRDPRPGPSGGSGKPATLGQRIVAATRKARGEA